MLVDITKDIEGGKYDHPKLSFFALKVFGRRIYVKLDNLILLGHIQYTFDKEHHLILVYINFEFRRNREHQYDNTLNLIIKEYAYEDGMDLDLYLKRIRGEIVKDMPQIEGYKWSFEPRDLV